MPHIREPHVLRLQQEYRDIAPVAAKLATTLAEELQHLVSRAGITLAVPIEFRVKTWDSIAHKFERANHDLTKVRFSGASLSDLGDLIGVRLVALFQRDIAQLVAVLDENLRVLDTHDKGARQAVDQFGYSSIHYQVRIPENWLSVPTFGAFRYFEAEVQVRTLAQHMWAAASHKLQYKHEAAVPDHMRRSIHRIASLLELVDTEYERLLVERDSYQDDLIHDRRARRLNTDVLEAILDARFPKANKAGYEPYSMLVWELEKLGLSTSDAVDALISRRLEDALAKERDAVEQGAERAERTGGVAPTHAFTHTGLLNMVLEAEYGIGFHSRIFEQVERELSGNRASE